MNGILIIGLIGVVLNALAMRHNPYRGEDVTVSEISLWIFALLAPYVVWMIYLMVDDLCNIEDRLEKLGDKVIFKRKKK